MEQHVRALEYCTYCPKLCRHSCPVAQASGRETLTPQAKMELLNLLRRTSVPWELDYVLPLAGCTTCQLCREHCRHGNDVATVLEAGRALAQQHGLIHPALSRLEERFTARNARLRARLHEAYVPSLFAEKGELGFFPGCDSIACASEDIADALAVFDSLGLGTIRLIDSPYVCAGFPLWSAGCTEAARTVAARMVQSLRRFSTVVSACPACTWLLRERLPAEGFPHDTEVLHLSEFLYGHAERLTIRATRPAAFYHDPCYLSRYLGVHEPPRQLVGRCVSTLKEFFYAGREAECCGGGGLVPLTDRRAALAQAERRLAEAQLFATPLVVTSCPTCKRTLRAVGSTVEVLDVINLLAWALQAPARGSLNGRSPQ